MNEQELIRRCQAGDMAAFGGLYDAYIDKIYRFVYYKTFHKETAEDVVSKVFMKAMRSIASFRPDSNFSAWIYEIARNAVIDHYRSQKDLIDIEEVWDLKADEDLVADTDNRARLEQLKSHLSLLDREKRELITMRVWDGLSYKEIALITGKSETSLKTQYCRIVKELKKSVSLAIYLLLIANI